KLAPYQSGAELSGNYTVQEARDRAAHSPRGPERGRDLFSKEERELLKENERDLKELYPTHEDWEKSYPDVDAPRDKEGQWQWNDLQEKMARKGGSNMTPEQQERVDQSLKNANIQRDSIGGASDVSGKPTPNDPGSLDKARDVGQDLNRNG